MNALQQLIADYLADNPGESYSSIARRGGISRQTVWATARRESSRQTPHPDTVAGLAKGMEMPESRVRAAAGMAAGYPGTVTSEITTERGRLIAEALNELDEERLESLARRARHLLAEMREDDSASGN
jgi:DNA invertase Pin-like site-specific DNA recombinase